MDFSKLAHIGKVKERLQQTRASEFDAHSFLNKADKLTKQIDSYFIEEPNDFLGAMDRFDESNDFAIFEMEICAADTLKRFL